MTVCVAAISERSIVVGASDQMLTAGDIQFEPEQPKVWLVTTSIVILAAGDSALQTEILQNVSADVLPSIQEKPDEWWRVRDVADLYSRYWNALRVRKAENRILAPLGLDMETFNARQGEMDSAIVRQIASELRAFETPFVEAIICGNDLVPGSSIPRPHIYTAHDGEITCHDATGFAAIGAGANHALSQFMFARHAPWKPFPETFLLTYSAKRRAEVAPGVGTATDLFSIGPQLGTFSPLTHHVPNLEKMYRDIRGAEARAVKRANVKVTQYVEGFAPEPGEQHMPPPVEAGDKSG